MTREEAAAHIEELRANVDQLQKSCEALAKAIIQQERITRALMHAERLEAELAGSAAWKRSRVWR